MCIDAPESTTNSRSFGDFEVHASPGFSRRVKPSFVNISMPLCGRNFLGASTCCSAAHQPHLHPDLNLLSRDTGGCQNSHDGFEHFLLRKLRNRIFPLVPERLVPELFEGYFPSVCAFALVQEKTIDLLVSHRIYFQTRDQDGNYMSLLSNIVQLLSTDSSLPPPFPRWLFSLLWLLVTAHLSTLVPGSEVLRPHCLINMMSVVSNTLSFIQSQYILKLNRILHFLTCIEPSRAVSVGISLAAKESLVSPCIKILNMVTV